MTLLRRLVVAAVVVVAAVTAAGFVLVHISRSSQIGSIDDQLRAAALRPARALARAAQQQPPLPPPPRVSSLSQLSPFYVATIDKGQRHTLVRSGASSTGTPALPATISTATHPMVATVGSLTGSGSWRAVLLRDTDGTEFLVAYSLVQVEHTTNQLWIALAVADAVTLSVLAVVLWWVYRLGIRPITDVTAVADAIARGDRGRRARSPRSRSEAAHLATAFNVMLDERDNREQLLRQFLADASHELRTPVTAISGITDMWRDGTLHGDRLQEALRRLGREATRMRGLIEDLLLLARLEEGRPLDRVPVALASLVEEATADLAATFPSRHVTTELAPMTVIGDPGRLRQVVANLVANSLVHTAPTSAVRVALARNNGSAVLQVSDDGPGLGKDETLHVFDRFWRADAARPRTGSGLGLPIVKAVVDAHHGTVGLQSDPQTGTTVVVTLPAEPAMTVPAGSTVGQRPQ